jgi:cytochrome c553
MKNIQVWTGVVALLISLMGVLSLPAKAETSAQAGQYLATAGDCISCHTAPGGKPFAGGLKMANQFGYLLTPNITPVIAKRS